MISAKTNIPFTSSQMKWMTSVLSAEHVNARHCYMLSLMNWAVLGNMIVSLVHIIQKEGANQKTIMMDVETTMGINGCICPGLLCLFHNK